jgi:hypothetical protein
MLFHNLLKACCRSDATAPIMLGGRNIKVENRHEPGDGVVHLINAARRAKGRRGFGAYQDDTESLTSIPWRVRRDLLIYCAHYKCSRWIRISADQWSDDVRLSDLEDKFACTASSRCGADIRPDFDWHLQKAR